MAHAGHAAPTTRPALEVADILRERGDAFGETHRLSAQQRRVVDALVNCRTAALGGFKAQCDHCGAVTIQYASCRNRHCPKCQTLSQTRWVERQCADLLDIGYWHVVFTLPHELNPVAQGNPTLIYRLLLQGGFPDPPRVRPQPPLARWRARHHHGPAYLGAESGTAHPRPLHRHRRRLEPGRAALVRPRAQGIPVPDRRALEGLPRQVSRLPRRRAPRRRTSAEGRRRRRQPRVRVPGDRAAIARLGGLHQGPVRRRRTGLGLSRSATPTRSPSATTVSSTSTASTCASAGATTPMATRSR